MHDSIPENLTQSAFDFDALTNQPVDNVVLHVNPTPPQEQKYWWSDLEHHHIPKSPGIYAIINRQKNHFYIGSAKNLRQRKNDHFKALKAGKHSNPHLQSAYNLYGSNAFLFVIVEHVDLFEDLLSREQHFIDTINPHYNIARIAGSNLGMTWSSKTKVKMSAAHRANPKMLENQAKATEAARIANTGRKLSPEDLEKRRGRKHTPEAISRMRIAKLGKPCTPETRAKLRAANLRNPPNLEAIARMRAANLGKPRSSETKEKLRIANLGRKHTPENLEKMRAAKLGKKQSPETKAKRSASLRGRKHTPEAVEKMRAAKKGKQFSPEHREKLSAAKQAKREARLAQQQAEQPPLF